MVNVQPEQEDWKKLFYDDLVRPEIFASSIEDHSKVCRWRFQLQQTQQSSQEGEKNRCVFSRCGRKTHIFQPKMGTKQQSKCIQKYEPAAAPCIGQGVFNAENPKIRPKIAAQSSLCCVVPATCVFWSVDVLCCSSHIRRRFFPHPAV